MASKDFIEFIGTSSADTVNYQAIADSEVYPPVPVFQALDPKVRTFLFVRSKTADKVSALPKLKLFGALKAASLVSEPKVFDVPVSAGTEASRKIDITDFVAGYPYVGVTIENKAGAIVECHVAIINSD